MEMSSRDFNQHVGEAKKLARSEPVFITDRGEASHVLLSIEEWRSLQPRQSTWDLLSSEEDLSFEPALLDEGPRAAEF